MSGHNKRPYKALRVPVCPCGGHIVIGNRLAVKRAHNIRHTRNMYEFVVYCKRCYDIAHGDTKREAIEAFNRLHEIKLTT